jgi:hypothetical protein
MPRKKQTPRNRQPLQGSPLPYSNYRHGTVRDWLRSIALQGTWADVCAMAFLEWYPVWKQTPQARELTWDEFRDQVSEAARRFWDINPQRSGRIGRPSDEQKYFNVIEKYLAMRPIDLRTWKPPSQGELIKVLRSRLSDSKPETCRKYARLWQLLNEKASRDFSTSDWKFLMKHCPDSAGFKAFGLMHSVDPDGATKLQQELAKSLANLSKLPF